jgi:WhiB family redox-sensing transcriptional regulator
MPPITPARPADRPPSPATKGNIIQLPTQQRTPLSGVTRLPCQLQDPTLWFSSVPAELNQAKAYCRECPIRVACLAGALEREEPIGVWGGEIFDNGRIIEFKRPRGRPRKSA